jgi:hypothetical protein
MGGETCLERFTNARKIMASGHKPGETPAKGMDLDAMAQEVRAVAAAERAKIVAGKFGGDLERMLAWFAAEEILF